MEVTDTKQITTHINVNLNYDLCCVTWKMVMAMTDMAQPTRPFPNLSILQTWTLKHYS